MEVLQKNKVQRSRNGKSNVGDKLLGTPERRQVMPPCPCRLWEDRRKWKKRILDVLLSICDILKEGTPTYKVWSSSGYKTEWMTYCSFLTVGVTYVWAIMQVTGASVSCGICSKAIFISSLIGQRELPSRSCHLLAQFICALKSSSVNTFLFCMLSHDTSSNNMSDCETSICPG
jgi:hypothetical protein